MQVGALGAYVTFNTKFSTGTREKNTWTLASSCITLSRQRRYNTHEGIPICP